MHLIKRSAIALAVALPLSLTFCGKPTPPPKLTPEDEAIATCEAHVSAATFDENPHDIQIGYRYAYAIEASKNMWVAYVPITSKNAFNATVTNTVVCGIEQNKDEFNIFKVEVEG